jgi:site-specific DNA-cytosine methylase
MSNVKWGQSVPLVGGLAQANKMVTGVDPSFFISYAPFGANEVHAKANFPNTPHYLLDSENMGGFSVQQNQDVDFISAVCPCAGLSLLSSGSEEQRAVMNSWMINTAKFVTGEVKPKVFWGENAPALYSNSGKTVRNQFREIAEENGYSFSIYGTNTELHGIPQSRKRTFYFFWKDSSVPVFEYFKRPRKNLVDYLDEVPAGADRHDQAALDHATKFLNDYPYVKFLQHKYNGDGINEMRRHLEKHEKRGTTMLSYLIRSEQLYEARDWLLTTEYDNHAREASRVIKKVEAGLGFWDGSMPIYRGDGTFATMIARTLMAIHPREDRILTVRENMHLMGLPHDYKLVTEDYNHLCQNVPVCTGADMTRMVMKYLDGGLKMSGSRFLMQSNINERIDVQESTLLEF